MNTGYVGQCCCRTFPNSRAEIWTNFCYKAKSRFLFFIAVVLSSLQQKVINQDP